MRPIFYIAYRAASRLTTQRSQAIHTYGAGRCIIPYNHYYMSPTSLVSTTSPFTFSAFHQSHRDLGAELLSRLIKETRLLLQIGQEWVAGIGLHQFSVHHVSSITATRLQQKSYS